MYRKTETDIGTTQGIQSTTQATQSTTQGTTQATQSTTQGTTQSTTQDTTQAELGDKDKSVLMSITENPHITQKEMAEKLNWKRDRVKYYLNKLKRKGFIKRVGTSQKGYWEVTGRG